MASEGKYMAYVGSYSYNGKAKGITFVKLCGVALKSHPAHNKIAHPHLNKANTRA